MDFFTVFVGYSGVVCGAGVCTQDDTIFVNEAYDGSTSFGGEGDNIIIFIGRATAGGGLFLELCFDENVTVDIVEIEASRGSV